VPGRPANCCRNVGDPAVVSFAKVSALSVTSKVNEVRERSRLSELLMTPVVDALREPRKSGVIFVIISRR
jgi:hypothetical protein